MLAEVERPDGTYEILEMGEPVCGEDFCDGCGDCLACQHHDAAEWCHGCASRWVIYLRNKRNPYRPAAEGATP